VMPDLPRRTVAFLFTNIAELTSLTRLAFALCPTCRHDPLWPLHVQT
jgi:hypothetical protein